MSIAILFWILMIISFIFGLWASWPLNPKSGGLNLLLFVLLALLGWKVFGAAIHN